MQYKLGIRYETRCDFSVGRLIRRMTSFDCFLLAKKTIGKLHMVTRDTKHTAFSVKLTDSPPPLAPLLVSALQRHNQLLTEAVTSW